MGGFEKESENGSSLKIVSSYQSSLSNLRMGVVCVTITISNIGREVENRSENGSSQEVLNVAEFEIWINLITV